MRDVPIWVWAPVVFLLLKIAYALGQRVGRRERELHGEDIAHPGGQVTLGAMLALLGLLLAFTYSFALNRFEDRTIVLLEETNAISTAFQWADLAEEPARTELRRLLLDYAKTRALAADVSNDTDKLRRSIQESLEALKKLWPAAKEAAGDPPYGPVQQSLAAAVITVGDISTSRIAVGLYRIPKVVLGLLVLVMCLAIALVAYRAARFGNFSVLRSNAFMIVLTALLIIILDFDHARAGFIQLDESSLRSLIADMEDEMAGD